MLFLIYLQIFIYFCLNLSKVFAIDCFQCVSTNTTDRVACRSFSFDQYSVRYVKECKQHIAGGHQQSAYACVKIVQQTIEENGHLLSESVIRDCISVPMKAGCEKRQVTNYESSSKRPSNTMIQCVYTCNTDGCNSSLSKDLSYLIGLISLALSIYIFKCN